MTQKTLETLKKGFDILISTAAIADYTPAETAKEKIKSGKTGLKIDLTPTKNTQPKQGRNFQAYTSSHSKQNTRYPAKTLYGQPGQNL